GKWTFVTRADGKDGTANDPDLHGREGTVAVKPNPDPDTTGFLTRVGSKYAIRDGQGNLRGVSYHVYQNDKGARAVFNWKTTKKLSDATQEDVDLYLDLAERAGFDSIFDTVAHRWLKDGAIGHNQHNSVNPDLDTFGALDMIITRTHARGKVAHFWAWGDNARHRRWTPVGLPGGINGKVDRRLQRYIAARLAPLPGWTMGYGFDLQEWTTEEQVGAWAKYMHEHMGWRHLLMARARSHAELDVVSHAHCGHSYEDAVKNLKSDPKRPHHFGERDCYRRSGYHTMDWTRRHLWRYTMAGGHSGHWGTWGNKEYPNPEQPKTHRTFWNHNFRLKLDMARANDLTDAYALATPDNQHYVFYAEDTDRITMDLSDMDGPQPAVAVDTKKAYREIDIGPLRPGKQTWKAPNKSDWAIAVGKFPGRDED
ncbi:MAG: hypothetical protein KGY99_10765, partial [Phycisphaerae bacterium]|nr:hypothetical protein [Phycisphaerae bacterium]